MTVKEKERDDSVCVFVCLTTPGSFISAMRYSGSPAGGSTSKVNSGLGMSVTGSNKNEETHG